MTIGVGGSTAEAEFARMRDLTGDVPAIGMEEWLARVERAQGLMREKGISALYLDSSVNLFYFTGIGAEAERAPARRRHPGRRPGHLPQPRLRGAEDPHAAELRRRYPRLGGARGPDRPRHGDDRQPRLRGRARWRSIRKPRSSPSTACARPATATASSTAPRSPRRAGPARRPAEIALLKRANEITLEVHKAAAAILR